MKHLLTLTFGFLFFIYGNISVLAFQTTTHSSIQTQCNGGNFPVHIYGNDGYHLYDNFNTKYESIISNGSSISVYQNSGKVTIPGNWSQLTQYVPKGGGRYLVFWDNGLTRINTQNLVPSDRNTIIGQAVVIVKRMYKGKNNSFPVKGSLGSTIFTGSIPSGPTIVNVDTSFDPSTVEDDVECINIYPKWCGDGVIDSAEGETCDDGADNGKPGKCSTTCDSTVPQDPVCGNNVLEDGEQCEPGLPSSIPADKTCDASCKLKDKPAESEKCDTLTISKTNVTVGESVHASCSTIPTGKETHISCGDGTSGGNGTTTCTYNAAGTYTLSCTLAIGFSPSIPCTATVTVTEDTSKTYCGDGIVQNPSTNNPNGNGTQSIYEQCEPSNPNSFDANTEICTNSCKKEPKPTGEYIDLAIKKFIESNDANTASQGPKHKKGDTFNYIFKVRNKGTKMVASTTTVQDTLPNGVELNGNPTGSNWRCTTSGKSITCTTGQDIAGGAEFTEIRVPVKVTATSGTITNHATVYNPDEDPIRSCLPNNQKPSVTATSCSQDRYNEDPAIFTVDNTAGISIKKYAEDTNGNRRDGQNGNDALELDPGEEFFYRYEVKATGNNTKATITDTFPHQVEILGFESNGWNCQRGTKTIDGNTHPTAICTRSTLATGDYTVRVRVKLKESTSTSAKLRNIAYVCSDETGPYTHSDGTKSCDSGCTDPNNPSCLPGGPGECSTIPTDPNYDPACIDPKTGINLKIKKHINSDDAQTAINKAENTTFDYVIKVENAGTKTVTGKTTVKDTLPSGVEKNGSITGTDWSCVTSGKSITCTTLREVAKNSFFPEIRIPVKVTATTGTIVRNYATVHNPNEDDSGCYSNNQMPSGNETSCPNDNNNIDPAIFKVPSPTDGMYVAAKCLTTTSKVCVSYSSYSACRDDQDRKEPCREANTAGYNQCNADTSNDVDVDCGGTEWEPDCNNGIIDQDWEECDTGGDTAWCVQCKLVDTVTNPGANPIEFWLIIPGLTNARVGVSHAFPQKIAFNKYAVVVGKGTSVFTLADTVGFDVKPKHPTPIKIPVDKKFCLQSSGTIFAGNSKACTTLRAVKGIDRNDFDTFNNGNQEYAVLGRGDYLVPNGVQTINGKKVPQYRTKNTKGTMKVNMFKGARIYNRTTLRDSFTIKDTLGDNNTKGIIQFVAQSANNLNAFNPIVEFKVQVSGVLLGTAGAPVNRKIADFINTTEIDIINDYLKKLGAQTSVLGSTSGPIQGSTTAGNTNTLTTPPINIRIGGTRQPQTIYKMSDLYKHKYNGNPNIYAINGDLTVDCTGVKDDFEMSGIKTVIVQGNIILNCNIKYKSNDYRASWAWIAQGGNISINNGTNGYKALTRLEGVYVATKDNSTGGDINAQQGKATSTILRVVGTLYGNAEPLFKSRTYVRGSGVYDILTTGTILTYSNRALVNTPPLLTQYLNHYKLSRVTQ